MYISKTRFINWTRCAMYFPLELKHNPSGKDDIDVERERREEMLLELIGGITHAEGAGYDDEEFDAQPSEELAALLPYYNQVEDEALRVARKYFSGTFVADYKDVHGQKLFEYELGGHTYRCYVDIYNENADEINIIEVKATTNSKFSNMEFSDVAPRKRGGNKYPLFVRHDNFWSLNFAASKVTEAATDNFKAQKGKLLNRYNDEGKYPHDLAFQRFVIESALRKAGDTRRVNYYLAVLNSEYVYDGAVDTSGARVYNNVEGQEIVTFYDMNEVTAEYQRTILEEIAMLESYISTLHDTIKPVSVGNWCAWKKNTECLFWKHCYQKLRSVPNSNKSNSYKSFRGFKTGDIHDKYQLINEGYYKLDDVPIDWLDSENHKIQRDCYDNNREHVDRDKMEYWLRELGYYPTAFF